ncbi:methionyl-tRNA formyltransferase [Mucilaginibacter lappiensis]|jgi:methionyl-tRNA formyltransferase|uniref:methionyl-tRNA formyltransferase n=1 Tax=Mucilaginibacter lappiensis TaxID=354630 RepID=UPI003D195A82
MKIGIVSNSAMLYMPLLSNLYNYKNKAGVMLYVGKSADPNQDMSVTAGFCNAAGIALTFETGKDDLYSWGQLYQPDIIFFVGYSSIVKTGQFTHVKHGIYNIHFGLLPQFRGPAPVFWQLRKGFKEIGLAIHRLTDKLDSGPVKWQHTVTNQPHFSYDHVNQLFGELQVVGVFEILNSINSGIALPEIEQDESKAAYYERPQLKDILINWDGMEAGEIIDMIKACNSWNMGAITMFNGLELKILDATITITNNQQYAPGTIIIKKNHGFGAVCKGNKLLNINYFKINNCYIPARFAVAYGFKTGQSFISQI